MPFPRPEPAPVVRTAPVRPAADLLPRLDAGERARLDRAPAPERDAVASVLLLARLVVAEVCGVDPAAVRVDRRCPRCGSTAHGVPRVTRADGAAAPHLSLSRTSDLVAVAVASGPVGIDLEPTTAGAGLRPDVVLADGEPPAPGPGGLLVTWVRKEAVLKAAGTGLAVDPRSLRVTDAAGSITVEHATPGPLTPPPGTRWHLEDLPLDPPRTRTHRAALAHLHPHPLPLPLPRAGAGALRGEGRVRVSGAGGAGGPGGRATWSGAAPRRTP